MECHEEKMQALMQGKMKKAGIAYEYFWIVPQ